MASRTAPEPEPELTESTGLDALPAAGRIDPAPGGLGPAEPLRVDTLRVDMPAGGRLTSGVPLPAGLPEPGPDDELITAAGLPPEVAAFLTATAVAAGVDPLTVLRGTEPRPRRRSRTSPDRVQRSFYLSRDLVDRARAAVSATMRRPGEAYNVSQLAGRALEQEVRRLELSYNDGQPFPPVSQVRSGPSPEGVERIRTGVTNPRRRRHA
jgi:Centromere-binding protein ParB C-terminal